MGQSGLRSPQALVLIGGHAPAHIDMFSPALYTLAWLPVYCSVPVINVENLIMAVDANRIL